MGKIKLGKYISEFSQKNRDKKPYPVYSVTNSSGFCTEYFTKDVSSEDKSNYKLVPYGYFAYNPSRINVGSVDCQDREDTVIVSPLYTVFSVSNKLNVNYLRYFFKSNYGKYLIKSKVSGSVRFNLKFSTLCNFEINEIGLEEQEKAVNLFSSIEDSIKTEEHELTLLDELIKSRFNEMFGKDDGDTSLDSLCEICRGASPRPIQNFITNDSRGINWIKIGDVDPSAIYITKTEEKITMEGASKSRIVHPGDFILSNSMSFGRPYILGIDGCVHDGWLIVSKYQKHYRPLFLYYLLRSESVQNQFNKNAGGTTVKNLNSDLVKKTKVKLYPLEAQDRFVKFAEQIDKLKFNVQKRIEKYKELLNKKMDEYFN